VLSNQNVYFIDKRESFPVGGIVGVSLGALLIIAVPLALAW